MLTLTLTLIFPDYASAANSKYIEFTDAGNEYLSITDGNKDGMDVTNDFTLEFWFNSYTRSATEKYVLFNTTGGNSGYYIVHSTTFNGLSLLWYDGSGLCSNRPDNNSSEFSDGAWHHYAFVIDVDTPENSIMYIDGVATTTETGHTACSGLANPNFTAEINAAENGTFDLDDLRLWDYKRNAEQILANYNCELTDTDLASTSLIMDLLFEDDANDSAGNNDWTENNGPSYLQPPPYSDECGEDEEEDETATSTPIQAPCSLLGINDIGVISWCELETNEAGTATTTRQGVAHIPLFVYIVFAIPLLWMGGRFLIEIIIRYRR